jgi:hypothetical protein
MKKTKKISEPNEYQNSKGMQYNIQGNVSSDRKGSHSIKTYGDRQSASVVTCSP